MTPALSKLNLIVYTYKEWDNTLDTMICDDIVHSYISMITNVYVTFDYSTYTINGFFVSNSTCFMYL